MKRTVQFLVMFLIFFVLSLLVAADLHAQTSSWKIKKTSWSQADENKYTEFVSLIGQAVEKRQCSSLKSCLQHPNNPYRGSDASQINVFADCGKLAYVIRGYFAWKNGLPFSYATAMVLRDVPGNTGDLRYSSFGNQVAARADVLPRKLGAAWNLVNAINTLRSTIPDSVYSANYRFIYSDGESAGNNYPDFYPVDISRDAIRPGTIIYDPNGHVAIVYKVTDDGKIYFIDAHPDNSLTSGLYGTKFVRSKPGQGAGFKNFRPLSLVGATYNSQLDSYVGGQIVATKNSQISDYSVVQFFGTDLLPRQDWGKGPFVTGGVQYEYYNYVRTKLSKGSLQLNPMNEVKSLAADICQSLQDRVEAVASAIKSGVQKKSHPERLPYNIYGTSGEWEEYSTPSRDARLKTSFKELRDSAEEIFNRYQTHDPQVVYHGQNIKADMLRAYQDVSRSCAITYQNSNGQSVPLNLEQARQRLFALSFDPYHCVELRWGAASAAELASCTDDANKRAWYTQERWLRNQIERRYDARMDFSLDQLTGPQPGGGVATPPDTDIVSFLSR